MPGTSRQASLPAFRPRTWARLGLTAYLIAGLGHWLGCWDLNAISRRGPDLCVFHRLTGLDCPGCGMGRSLILLAQGRLQDSWTMHPFGILFFLWMMGWAILPREYWLRWKRDQHAVALWAPTLVLVLLMLRWVGHVAQGY
jgi:hypothetical protein